MAKVMLVEDDTNLSEIYQARMAAEGYEIVTAHDGEEALATAAKEKPDLIISDVMMPKISGFEMLDILRNTEGLKSTKVIMLTALGQAEDRTRAQGLGADRYLVKSQVTLEDIVKAAQELLNSTPAQPQPVAAPAVAPASNQAAAAAPAPAITPVVPQAPTPAPVQAAPVQPSPVPVANAMAAPAPTPVPAPTLQSTPMAPVVTRIPVAEPPARVAPVAPVLRPAPPNVSTVAAASPIPQTPPVPQPSQASTVVPVVAAPALPSTPVTPAPVAPAVNTASANDDQLVSNAVANLKAATAGPAPIPMQTPAVVPVAAPTPATSAPAHSNTMAEEIDTNNKVIAHKKVIKPIDDGSEPPKPDLQTLLAAEERKNPADLSQPAAANGLPHQPGNLVTPTAPMANSNLDPNQVAL